MRQGPTMKDRLPAVHKSVPVCRGSELCFLIKKTLHADRKHTNIRENYE